MDIINQVNGTLNKGFNVVNNNQIASIVLGLFLALYAALAAPNLPSSVTEVFKNSLFRLAVMFLIVYMATKDVAIAIITAIAFLVTLQTLVSQETANSVVAAVEQKVQANIEKFASVPAKSSDNYDDDIEDYSLSNSDQLLYSGGGLHSLPDNVTDYDQENITFQVSSPAFLDDARAIEADKNIYEQQINGDTYNEVGMEMDSKPDNNNYDYKKVQQVPYAMDSNASEPLGNEAGQIVSNAELVGLPQQAVLPKVASQRVIGEYHGSKMRKLSKKNKDSKKYNKKNSKKDSKKAEKKIKNAVEGFSGVDHFSVNFENELESDSELESEDSELESEDSELEVEGFQNPEDFEGTCGADPGEAVPGFDLKEFAAF